jgi:hypothetical protein
MATFKEDPAAYMRAWRARKREEAGAVTLGAKVRPDPKDRPLVAQAERARVKAQREYEAPGGRRASATQVTAAGGRAAALVMAQGVVTKSIAPAAIYRPPAPPPAMRSMHAVGGVAGKGLVPMGRGYPAPPDIAAHQFERYATMLEALSQRSDQQGRQLAEHDRQIAQLVARDAERDRANTRGSGIASALGALAASFLAGMATPRSRD